MTAASAPRRVRAITVAVWLSAWLTLCGVGAVAAKPFPRPVGGVQVAPEVFWVTISINGQRQGFGRGQYTHGEAAPYQVQNLLLFNHGGYRHAERDWWEFGPDLRPANFYQKIISWRAGMSVTNTVDGLFHYDKMQLICQYDQFKVQEKVEVAIPPHIVARFTQNLLLAHKKLAVGKTFSFRVYDINNRRFALQQYRVTGFDASRKAWQLNIQSEEAPGVVTTCWFQTASAAHPNGVMVRSEMPGPENTRIELQNVTREEAIQGFEKEAATLGI